VSQDLTKVCLQVVRTNEDQVSPDKIRQYHSDYNNRPSNSISFMSDITSTSGSLHSELVCLLFLQTHRETDHFLPTSGVQLPSSDRDQFHYHRTTVSSHLKSKVGNILVKAEALWITLNIDGSPITSKSHTHTSHSQTFRLLTSSLSLGVPVPHSTQCM
jgi:hypothetical protein